jgi:predicted component of type VI protein secretion system
MMANELEMCGDVLRDFREILIKEINACIERYEKRTSTRIESVNVSWKTEKGTGGLDPDKEVRTIDIQITI